MIEFIIINYFLLFLNLHRVDFILYIFSFIVLQNQFFYFLIHSIYDIALPCQKLFLPIRLGASGTVIGMRILFLWFQKIDIRINVLWCFIWFFLFQSIITIDHWTYCYPTASTKRLSHIKCSFIFLLTNDEI